MITLYTTTTCQTCIPIKEYLNTNQIEYTEKLVDLDNDAAGEMIKKSNQKSVPILVVTKKDGSEEIVVGHDLTEIAAVISEISTVS